MIGLLQRVTWARVEVAEVNVAEINRGLLVFVGVERDDRSAHVQRLGQRLLSYRVFADAEGRMNLSVQDIQGGVLLVPQFTLPADTRKGNRPSFTPAAPPQQGEQLFNELLEQIQCQHHPVAHGVFGANMQVSLTNDGPVTFWLQV